MGIFGKFKNDWNKANVEYQIGCEVLGPPSTIVGFQGSLERSERMTAGRRKIARRQAIDEAKRKSAEVYGEPTRENGYFSQDRGYGAADYYIGKDGQITSERPHVHVVHNPREGRIIFTVTQRDGSHSPNEYLPITASGDDVNTMQERLRRQIR